MGIDFVKQLQKKGKEDNKYQIEAERFAAELMVHIEPENPIESIVCIAIKQCFL